MKSSFYFRFPELIATGTKLDNCPVTFEQISNLLSLANKLTCLRIVFGSPIIVNSGYRSPEVNSLVGGVPNSKHLDGLAADITCSPLEFDKLCIVCQSFFDRGLFTECIVKSNFIHVAI